MSRDLDNDDMSPGPPGDAEQEALDVPRVTEVAGGHCLLDDGAVPQGRDSTRGGGGVVHQETRARLASKMVMRLGIKTKTRDRIQLKKNI